MGVALWGMAHGSMLKWVQHRLEWEMGEGRTGVGIPVVDELELEIEELKKSWSSRGMIL